MNYAKSIIFLLLTISGFLVLQNISCQKVNQKILVKVNRDEITADNFLSSLPKPQGVESAEETNLRYQTHLDKLINKLLFIQEAKQRGFSSEVEPTLESHKKTMLVYKLKSQEINEKAKVTPEMIEQIYELLPIEVHLDLITVKTQAEADQVEKQLKAGMSFESCAKQFSTHPSSENGGDAGFGKLAYLSEPVRKAIENLKPGTITTPVNDNGEFYIIKLIEKRQVPVKDIETEVLQIKTSLEQQRYRELHQKFLAQLNSRLTYNPKALQVFNKSFDQITDEEKELWVVKKDETLMVRVKSLMPIAEKFNPGIGPEVRVFAIKSEIEDEMVYEEAKLRGLDQEPAFKKELNRIYNDLLYQVLYQNEVTNKTSVSEPEILAYYNDRKANYPGGWSESVRNLIQDRILTERKNMAEANLAQQLRANAKIEINQRLYKTLVNTNQSEKEKK